MPSFSRLIRFESSGDGQIYFADLGDSIAEPPALGVRVVGYRSLEDLNDDKSAATATVGKVLHFFCRSKNGADSVAFQLLAPMPYGESPIYCVGLNYRSHAAEGKLPVPKHPPLWTKPAAALAAPDEQVLMNEFCASSYPDCEGELVFVTSRTCRDVGPAEAESCILGYTVGNDFSCRLWQLSDRAGGQFYFANAFDKFAPIGPVLVNPERAALNKGVRLTTRVNGVAVQTMENCKTDWIWSPAQILSWMSRGTTIPAGTAVMTGTPAGVGAFREPKQFLQDGDVVEVEISNIGVLRNQVLFV
ncbi:related to bifunctional 4-hydroxyphenylacetate degradation enzyme [Neofusicoccum parvum]|nr:related to bifunctional 4-hydroxyphenylacetate degradation enzyme [Neofusicoccum parvum]